MKNVRILSAALVLTSLIAACDTLPTENASATQANASYDGGFTMGSGNRGGTDGTEDAGTMSGGTTQSDTTNRGGFGMGSGN